MRILAHKVLLFAARLVYFNQCIKRLRLELDTASNYMSYNYLLLDDLQYLLHHTLLANVMMN